MERDTLPRAEDVVLGDRLVEAGADMIFGGHAHRLQPMRMRRGRPVFYSLGNFVWPNLSVAGSTTAVAEVRVGPARRSTRSSFPRSSPRPAIRSCADGFVCYP